MVELELEILLELIAELERIEDDLELPQLGVCGITTTHEDEELVDLEEEEDKILDELEELKVELELVTIEILEAAEVLEIKLLVELEETAGGAIISKVISLA